MQHTRWYHIDPHSGQKVIRRFGVDVDPGSPWKRGTGPHSPEARAKIAEYNRIHFKDKPKSAETRQKMRDAKLGKKNSKEHCAKIAQAWEDKRQATKARNQEAMQLVSEMLSTL
jgi:hypothetical protein|tara:strand:- start:396 stop:737 length:342 start_codon:yes stop_codon:yes gene_type:complete